MSSLCTSIRKVVERAVEEVLLSEIVGRYRRAIHVSKIRDLSRIKPEDTEFLDNLMSKYSAFEHAQAPEGRAVYPDLEEASSDVDALSAWAREFRQRN
jgi:hypothetical protein